jgi:hypothetical protein
MDYKLNHLAKEVRCEEVGIPDLPDIKFGHLENGMLVFNATAYLKTLDREEDYRTFSRAMRFWIEQLASGYGLNTSELFYANPNGEELYNETMVYLLLMYTDPSIVSYFNDIIDDVMTNGIAFSDSFILSLAQSRLPDDVKQGLIQNDKRKNRGV